MGYLDEGEEVAIDLTVKFLMGLIVSRLPFMSFPLLRIPLKYFLNWVISKGFEFLINGVNYIWISIENDGEVEKVEEKFKEMKNAPDKETRKKKEKEYDEAAIDLIRLRTEHL